MCTVLCSGDILMPQKVFAEDTDSNSYHLTLQSDSHDHHVLLAIQRVDTQAGVGIWCYGATNSTRHTCCSTKA